MLAILFHSGVLPTRAVGLEVGTEEEEEAHTPIGWHTSVRRTALTPPVGSPRTSSTTRGSCRTGRSARRRRVFRRHGGGATDVRRAGRPVPGRGDLPATAPARPRP